MQKGSIVNISGENYDGNVKLSFENMNVNAYHLRPMSCIYLEQR